jgi:hypothetical protein
MNGGWAFYAQYIRKETPWIVKTTKGYPFRVPHTKYCQISYMPISGRLLGRKVHNRSDLSATNFRKNI